MQNESYPIGNVSPWDKHCTIKSLEDWLYAPRSIKGLTRQWFVDQVFYWPEGSRFLDAGCGGGVTLYTMAQEGLLQKFKCVGIDSSSKMLEVAKRKVPEGCEFRQGDLRTLDAAEQYDRILLRAVLEHHDDPASVLSGVLSLLASNGVLYIIWWNNPVYSEPLHTMTDWGVPDTAHNAPMVRKVIEECGCHIAMQKNIIEQSARSSEREIWIIQHKKALP